MATRKRTTLTAKQGLTTPNRPSTPQDTSTLTTNPDSVSCDSDLETLMASLSQESKTMVTILKMVITNQFTTEIEALKEELTNKDSAILKLQSEVSDLQHKVTYLETTIDSVEQYERRDTIIVSGPSLPSEVHTENAKNIIVNTIRNHLKINIKDEDISVAHRLGKVNQNKKRPIIMKLVNRSMKHDLVSACINLKPNLYINESLTPTRQALFKKVLAVRAQHRAKFQQCHTQEGRIIVKLKNSTVRHVIVDHQGLVEFLDKYPDMKQTYMSIDQ